jgi:hypothetical protein
MGMNKVLLLMLVAVMLLFTYGCAERGNNGGGKTQEEEIIKGEVISGEIVPSDSSMDKDIQETSSSEFVVEGTVGETGTDKTTTTSSGGTTTTVPVYEGSLTSKGGPFYRVQVSASSSKEGADTLAEKVRTQVPDEPVYVESIGGYWKVRVGDCKDKITADLLKTKLKDLGYTDCWVVAP